MRRTVEEENEQTANETKKSDYNQHTHSERERERKKERKKEKFVVFSIVLSIWLVTGCMRVYMCVCCTQTKEGKRYTKQLLMFFRCIWFIGIRSIAGP